MQPKQLLISKEKPHENGPYSELYYILLNGLHIGTIVQHKKDRTVYKVNKFGQVTIPLFRTLSKAIGYFIGVLYEEDEE